MVRTSYSQVPDASSTSFVRKGNLPGGFRAGDVLYYIGVRDSAIVEENERERPKYGLDGLVLGPATLESHAGKGVKLSFFLKTLVDIDCLATELSREAPSPLPQGYVVGESVYFLGRSQTVAGGGTLLYANRGEVLGPAGAANARDKALSVHFEGLPRKMDVVVSAITYIRPPPLPGGFEAGEQLFYVGAHINLESGERLKHGEHGYVVGPATDPRSRDEAVMMRFGHLKEPRMDLKVSLLRREPTRASSAALEASREALERATHVEHDVPAANSKLPAFAPSSPGSNVVDVIADLSDRISKRFSMIVNSPGGSGGDAPLLVGVDEEALPR